MKLSRCSLLLVGLGAACASDEGLKTVEFERRSPLDESEFSLAAEEGEADSVVAPAVEESAEVEVAAVEAASPAPTSESVSAETASPEPAAAIEATVSREMVAQAEEARVEAEFQASPQPQDLRVEPSAEVAAILSTDQFKRRFAESYLSETDIEPTLPIDQHETMVEILDLISNEQYGPAVQRLRQNLGPNASPVFYFTLANVFFQTERYEPAAINYGVAVERFPKFLRAWRLLGICRVTMSQYDQAIPALSKVIELGGADALTYGMLGFAHATQGNDLAAESAYRMAVMLDPETNDWQMGLARALFQQLRFAEAASLCDALLAERPEASEMWLLQANAYIGMGEPMMAAENYEFVDALGDSTVDSLQNLADIYVNEELYGLGVDAYLRALAAGNSASPERPMRAARVMISRGAIAEVEELVAGMDTILADRLDEAQQLEFLKLQALVLANTQGAGEAEAALLQEMVELNPTDGEAILLLGDYRRDSGEIENAIFLYERAAAIDGYEADAKIRHGQLLVNQGDYAGAVPLLRRALTLRQSDHLERYLDQVERASQNR